MIDLLLHSQTALESKYPESSTRIYDIYKFNIFKTYIFQLHSNDLKIHVVFIVFLKQGFECMRSDSDTLR